MAGVETHNVIADSVVIGWVVQGRDITVHLPAPVPPALSGLPAATARFSGRGVELGQVLALLDPSQAAAGTVLVSAVAGLAGVGKTELALQAAHTAQARGWFPGGVLFVDLHGYDQRRRLEPEVALDGLLRALGVPAEQISPDLQGRARQYASVLAAFAKQGHRLLVVVDNASSVEQARPLLPTDRTSRAVVTSRHTLGGLEARLLDLDVLDRGDAVEMLDRSLRAARGARRGEAGLGRPDPRRLRSTGRGEAGRHAPAYQVAHTINARIAGNSEETPISHI